MRRPPVKQRDQVAGEAARGPETLSHQNERRQQGKSKARARRVGRPIFGRAKDPPPEALRSRPFRAGLSRGGIAKRTSVAGRGRVINNGAAGDFLFPSLLLHFYLAPPGEMVPVRV